MKSMLFVMTGGAIGAGLRFALSRALPVGGVGCPWPTFAANLIGGFAMGMLAAWMLRNIGAENIRLFLGVGVLGGFTTFSAFSLEMAQMIQRGQAGMAFAYALFSVTLALLALFAGMTMMKAVMA